MQTTSAERWHNTLFESLSQITTRNSEFVVDLLVKSRVSSALGFRELEDRRSENADSRLARV